MGEGKGKGLLAEHAQWHCCENEENPEKKNRDENVI